MIKPIFALALAVSSTFAMAESWTCRNQSAEISCDDQHCEVNQDGFTPFDISTNGKNELSVCAYSGCWSGKATTFQAKPYLIVTGHQLKWSHDAKQTPAQFMLNIDTKSKVGFIQGEGFAMPIQCKTLR